MTELHGFDGPDEDDESRMLPHGNHGPRTARDIINPMEEIREAGGGGGGGSGVSSIKLEQNFDQPNRGFQRRGTERTETEADYGYGTWGAEPPGNNANNMNNRQQQMNNNSGGGSGGRILDPKGSFGHQKSMPNGDSGGRNWEMGGPNDGGRRPSENERTDRFDNMGYFHPPAPTSGQQHHQQQQQHQQQPPTLQQYPFSNAQRQPDKPDKPDKPGPGIPGEPPSEMDPFSSGRAPVGNRHPSGSNNNNPAANNPAANESPTRSGRNNSFDMNALFNMDQIPGLANIFDESDGVDAGRKEGGPPDVAAAATSRGGGGAGGGGDNDPFDHMSHFHAGGGRKLAGTGSMVGRSAPGGGAGGVGVGGGGGPGGGSRFQAWFTPDAEAAPKDSDLGFGLNKELGGGGGGVNDDFAYLNDLTKSADSPVATPFSVPALPADEPQQHWKQQQQPGGMPPNQQHEQHQPVRHSSGPHHNQPQQHMRGGGVFGPNEEDRQRMMNLENREHPSKMLPQDLAFMQQQQQQQQRAMGPQQQFPPKEMPMGLPPAENQPTNGGGGGPFKNDQVGSLLNAVLNQQNSTKENNEPNVAAGLDLGKGIPLPPRGKVFSLAEIEAGLKGLAMEQESKKKEGLPNQAKPQQPIPPPKEQQEQKQLQHHQHPHHQQQQEKPAPKTGESDGDMSAFNKLVGLLKAQGSLGPNHQQDAANRGRFPHEGNDMAKPPMPFPQQQQRPGGGPPPRDGGMVFGGGPQERGQEEMLQRQSGQIPGPKQQQQQQHPGQQQHPQQNFENNVENLAMLMQNKQQMSGGNPSALQQVQQQQLHIIQQQHLMLKLQQEGGGRQGNPQQQPGMGEGKPSEPQQVIVFAVVRGYHLNA